MYQLLFMESLFENFLYLDSQERCKTLEKLSVDLELQKKSSFMWPKNC